MLEVVEGNAAASYGLTARSEQDTSRNFCVDEADLLNFCNSYTYSSRSGDLMELRVGFADTRHSYS